MNINEKKRKQLGMPFGTANGRLKKMIFFSLVKETKKDMCFRCGKKIKNIKDLSVEHKKPWLDESVDLFWDLNNIAFSHLKCNSKSKRPSIQIHNPPGMNWCNVCKEFLPTKNFWKNRNRPSGYNNYCKKHPPRKKKI